MCGKQTHRLSGRPWASHVTTSQCWHSLNKMMMLPRKPTWRHETRLLVDGASKLSRLSSNNMPKLSSILSVEFNSAIVHGWLTCVTSLSHGLKTSVHTASRVDYRRFFHDETIFFQTSDVATRVGQRNFVDFIWIQPNFTLSAFEYGGREALLKFKWHHGCGL